MSKEIAVLFVMVPLAISFPGLLVAWREWSLGRRDRAIDALVYPSGFWLVIYVFVIGGITVAGLVYRAIQ